MWSDVVSCGNEDKLFSSFQWYHDDTLIAGANKQFYCDLNGLSGTYWCVSPHRRATVCLSVANILRSRRRLSALWRCLIRLPAIRSSILKVSGLDEGQLQRAKLYIYAENGILVLFHQPCGQNEQGESAYRQLCGYCDCGQRQERQL